MLDLKKEEPEDAGGSSACLVALLPAAVATCLIILVSLKPQTIAESLDRFRIDLSCADKLDWTTESSSIREYVNASGTPCVETDVNRICGIYTITQVK